MNICTVTCTLTFITLFALSSVQAQEIKCWTNNDGVRECGNAVPPEYAQQGYNLLDDEGTVVHQVEAAKTAEEIAEEKRQHKMMLEASKRLKMQEESDQHLLQQYSSLKEIERMRKAQISLIQTRIDSIQNYINSLERNLARMEKNIEGIKDKKDAQAQKLKDDIQSLKIRIDQGKLNIREQQTEISGINLEYDGYAARYNDIIKRRAASVTENKKPATDTPPQ